MFDFLFFVFYFFNSELKEKKKNLEKKKKIKGNDVVVSLPLNQNKDLKNTQIPNCVNFPNNSFERSTLSTVKMVKGVASSTVSVILDESSPV